MPVWTKQDLIDYERKRQRDRHVAQPAAKPEPPVCSGRVEKAQDQKVGAQQYLLCIEDYRTRLADWDNLCPKFRVDALRYAGKIPDDRPDLTRITVHQTKVQNKAQERTVIRAIEYSPNSLDDMAAIANELVPGPEDRPLIYLACPYVDKQGLGREFDRFNAATKACAFLIKQGHNVFSPITHSHPLVPYGLPNDWAFWKRFDLAFLRCTRQLRVLTMDGWKESVGIKGEMDYCMAHSIPIEFMDPP